MHERSKDGGKYQIIGNETILGHIASYMESLHLTYKQVYEEIPLRNLVLMQKDKLHESSADVIVKKSSTEIAGKNIK